MNDPTAFPKQLKIALDFDDTYTADSGLWSAFVYSAKSRHHIVKFVTFRYPTETEDIEQSAKMLGIEIIYTSRQQKRLFWNADIWIDDLPEVIPVLLTAATNTALGENLTPQTSTPTLLQVEKPSLIEGA